MISTPFPAIKNSGDSEARYSETTASVAAAGAALYPPFVTRLPAIGMFVHSEAVRTITPHHDYEMRDVSRSQDLRVRVVDETDAFLELTLGELKPAFALQLRGSSRRAEERGPDWWTQAAASLRKLLLGVLHTAAPDDLVLPWVTNHTDQVDRTSHPTRRTKIAWLCNSIANAEYRKCVKTEVDSVLALIDVLDSANHVDEFPEFEESFSWTVLRVRVAIRHIFTIWKSLQER